MSNTLHILALMQPGKEASVPDLMALSGFPGQAVSRTVFRLWKYGQLERVRYGVYILAANPTPLTHMMTAKIAERAPRKRKPNKPVFWARHAETTVEFAKRTQPNSVWELA